MNLASRGPHLIDEVRVAVHMKLCLPELADGERSLPLGKTGAGQEVAIVLLSFLSSAPKSEGLLSKTPKTQSCFFPSPSSWQHPVGVSGQLLMVLSFS